MATPFFRVDASELRAQLRHYRLEATPFQLAYALTKTAQDIRDGERETMRAVFDRPTPFTINSLYVKPATKTDLQAIVYFKEGFNSIPAWKYLGPQVEGGPRKHKRHERALISAGVMRSEEYAVPGKGVTLDQYGNMRGGEITRILSQLRASSDPMQNATNSRRSKTKRRTNGYFAVRGHGRLKPGVYQRAGLGKVKPIIMFVRAPRYTKRFPFYERGQAIFQQRFVIRMREAIAKYPPRRARAA